jgi:hypothetical protein
MLQVGAERMARGERGAVPRGAPQGRTSLPGPVVPSSPASLSTQVEAVQIHHLRTRGDEVLDELLARVRARVDLGPPAQLRIRVEPLEFPRVVDAAARVVGLRRMGVQQLERQALGHQTVRFAVPPRAD